MADANAPRIRLAGETRPQTFRIEPGTEARARLAEDLGILGVRKLRFEGTVSPEGKRDWVLDGTLGATAVQACVVTLDPVTTRIDVPVTRRYVADLPEPEPGAEVEMPEDDTVEALPETLDLAQVMAEALALALPDFPRAEGVDPVEIAVTEPGKTAMTDDDAKPFAGLAELREKLAKKGEKDG